jgi:hypothetical protein
LSSRPEIPRKRILLPSKRLNFRIKMKASPPLP